MEEPTVFAKNGPTLSSSGVVPARRRGRRRVLLLVWLVVATLVVLEAVMQVGAYVVWLEDRKPPPDLSSGQDVVLCVGDSWTHGMGSSDPKQFSYPARLQPLLRKATNREWIVVNGGQSGQNSRDVLQRLPSQLAEFRPRVVCVLVGMNDFWSMPAELTEGLDTSRVDHSSYRLRWRIPRLIDWLVARYCGPGATGSAGPAPRGPEWAPRVVEKVYPYRNEPTKWPSNEASRAHQREGWRRNDAKDLPGALAAFELALAADGGTPLTRQLLVELYRKNSRPDAAAPHLQWLLDAWAREQDYWSGSSLVGALSSSGRHREALDVASRFLERFPDDGTVWRQRAEAEFALGLNVAAKQSIDTAIRLCPDRWTYFYRYKIHYLGLQDVDEGIRSIYRAYVALNDATAATADLRALTDKQDPARLQVVLASFECEPAVRARLIQIVEDVVRSKDGAAAAKVLSAHLEHIVNLIRNSGATPVFLTYPVRERAEDCLHAVAEHLEVKVVEVMELFGARLAPRRWADVRASDGHCNDIGYQVMAQIVAEGLQSVLAAAGR